MTGHLLGGAGGIESVFTVLALHDQISPPTINIFNQDPEVRPRLLRQRGAADEDRVRGQEQLRIRRHQRHACLQAGLSARVGVGHARKRVLRAEAASLRRLAGRGLAGRRRGDRGGWRRVGAWPCSLRRRVRSRARHGRSLPGSRWRRRTRALARARRRRPAALRDGVWTFAARAPAQRRTGTLEVAIDLGARSCCCDSLERQAERSPGCRCSAAAWRRSGTPCAARVYSPPPPPRRADGPGARL